MVEIKKEFWDPMSEKGIQEGQLKNDLRDLRDYFQNDINLPKVVFRKDTSIFITEFLEQVAVFQNCGNL